MIVTSRVSGAADENVRLDRVHHIGINVSDLHRSIGFYRDLFGVDPLFVNDMRGEGLATGAGLPEADLRFCMMKISNVVLEIIEWRTPNAKPALADGPHVGGFHIAFEVDDIDAVHRALQARGIEFTAALHRFGEADEAPSIAGATFVYFKDPDGIGLEVYQKRSRYADY
jgi:catechol 2,3-dioxygenase-like lactoylglutathione lyase family enzyme